MYIYPDNLKSKAVLWLWQLRDIGIIGIGGAHLRTHDCPQGYG